MPPPLRGAVIRYSYLWAREFAKGQIEGRKNRPALVIAISVIEANDIATVYVLAITHSPPSQNTDAIALPLPVKRKLGLDEEPAWIVTTEANAFSWPGPDIRPISIGRIVYGYLPEALLAQAIRSFLDNRKKKRATVVTRTS